MAQGFTKGLFFFFFAMATWNFPDRLVVKNQPSNIGDVGSIPGQGTKIPHAVGQLRLHTLTKT